MQPAPLRLLERHIYRYKCGDADATAKTWAHGYCHSNCLVSQPQPTGRDRNVPRQRRSAYARRAFSVAVLLVWDSLLDYMRDPAVGRDTFFKALKTFLFAVY